MFVRRMLGQVKKKKTLRYLCIVKTWKEDKNEYMWIHMIWEEQHPEDFQIFARFLVKH